MAVRLGAATVFFAFLLLQRGYCEDLVVPLHPAGVENGTRRSIERGVAYLVREQNSDGSWRTDGRIGNYPVAMSSLAGLALLASGSTPARGPHARQVRKLTDYLLSRQDETGLISAPVEEGRSMYGHGFATLFLAEVYGMEEDTTKMARIREALRRAVALIGRAQSRMGGWFYTPNSGSDEGSVTVTQVQALRACRNAGIAVPKKVIEGAIGYIEKSQNADGGISYRVGQGGSRTAITAAACAVLYNAGVYDSPAAGKAFVYAWNNCRPDQGGNGNYFYTQLYMSQACWQMGKNYWTKYYSDMQDRLLGMQQSNGSWQGDGVGTVYGTAIALLILQLPYNHLPILSR